MAPSALAANFAVNTTADTVDVGGCATAVSPCSVRDAVIAANAAPGSTIQIRAGHYTLNPGASPQGQLAITAATTIIGAGARSTIIDGNGKSRVFDFEPASTTTAATIQDLSITGGATPAVVGVPYVETDPGDGAGIFSLGGLDLEHVTITGNTASLGGGGVMDGTIHDIEPGPATFNAVTIASNHVAGGAGNGQGGGAVVAAVLTMTNSTIANNSVANVGVNEGGGLVSALDTFGSNGQSATLVNDTITGNTVAKPVSVPVGDFGGGISGDSLAGSGVDTFESVLDATNTIVAGNQVDGAEQDCSLINTGPGTSNHNITGDATCGFTDAGTQQTTALGLGALQNNGGPADTLLPAAGSPAIDKADATACPATDERGVIRPQGVGCDVGAAELAPPSAVTGPASSITPTGATTAGTATNPAVAPGTAVIQYGTGIPYGQSTAAGAVAAGAVSSAQSANLPGLTPGTTYHYRLFVTTTDGTAAGADATFKTPVRPTSTTVTCSPSSVVLHRRTICTATVAETGAGAPSTATGTVKFTAGTRGGAFGHSGACTLAASTIPGKAQCAVAYTTGGSLGGRTISAAYGGDAHHGSSSGHTTISVRGSTSLKILSIHAFPTRLGCVAEIGRTAHSATGSSASAGGETAAASASRPSCNRVRLVLTAQVPSDLTKSVLAVATGGFSGRHFTVRANGVGAHHRHGRPYPTGTLTASLILPARDHEPGDRWTIALRFGGDAGHLPATTSTTRIVEGEIFQGKPSKGDLPQTSQLH